MILQRRQSKQLTILGENMQNSNQIHFSTKYELFQLIDENRAISSHHVDSFIKDKKFPAKFPTCPILVDKNLRIIDGQHRFKAAENLKIPIYYIIDETATNEDIVIRNSRVKPWKVINFVDFYASQGKKSYVLLKKLVEKHKIPVNSINTIITKLGDIRTFQFTYMLKGGTLNIKAESLSMIENVCDMIFPVLKECISQRGRFLVLPLLSSTYMCAYAYYYVQDEKLLKRFLKKIFIFPQFSYVKGFEAGREAVKKIANWNPKNHGINKEELDEFIA